MIDSVRLPSDGLEMVAREWRLSVDALKEELCLLDAEDRVLRCNRAMQEQAGRAFGEIVGQRFCAAVCGQETCSRGCPLPRVHTSGGRVVGEVLIGGRVCRMTADPVLDQARAFAGSVLVLSDLTAVRRSEMLYRTLTDCIPSSVLLLDGNLRVLFANRNFLHKSRRTESETLGRPLSEVFPDVILTELGLENQIRQVFGCPAPKQAQRLTYRAPGVPIRVYFYSIVPVALGPHADHVLVLMDDITEQTRLSEEIGRMERHLASVVESASDLVVSVDSAGKIITWNQAAERITGYRLEEVKSLPLLGFLDAQEQATDLFERGPIPEVAEWDVLTKAGRHRPVSWVISRMSDNEGRVQGYVAVGRDLAERRKFEHELLQSQKLAALGVMAGGIAHEIRTPLTIASSSAQFLMEEDISAEFRRECARKVRDGIQRASTIVESLLRFGRLDRQTDWGPVDLAAVIVQAVTVIASQASVGNVRVRTRLPDEPLTGLGVASLLEQVFVNLLLNAIHAMPEGGEIQIDAGPASGEAVVRMIDGGHGISPDDIDRIFDPFYTRDSSGKGIGLGLSLCYSIIKQHLGSIEVASEPGKGAVFTVRLPLL